MSTAARWQAAAVLYAAAVFVISIIPVDPQLAPGQLDKVVHLCEYLLFAWLLVQLFSARRMTPHFLQAWLLATLYGGLIEGIQAFLPWRSADWMDGWLNALGAAIGIAAARFYSPAKQHTP